MSDSVGEISLDLILGDKKFQAELQKAANNAVNQIGKTTNKIQQNTSKLGSNIGNSFKKLGTTLAAAFSAAAVVKFGKDCISVANEVENAWVGLNSIINGQGKSFNNAKKFIQDYISDGLVPLNNAITAYKNLSLRGYSEEQTQSVMTAFKNSATFARQSQYSLGEAISTATEGLKNENSIVVDNAGVTKNVAKMWEDYAKSIGVSTTSLTKQQKIEAEVAGILEETKFQMGDAAKYANTYSGKVAKLNSGFTNLKTKLGNIIKTLSKIFIPAVNMVISAIDRLADRITNVLNGFGIQTDITDTLFDVSDIADDLSASTNDTAQGISDTTEEAKKLKKVLAGFDQLNILSSGTDEENADVDTQNTANIPLSTVDTSKTETKLTKSLDNIKEKIENIFKDSGIGDFVKEIQKGISSIDFAAIGSNFLSIMQSLKPIAEASFKGLRKIAKSGINAIGKAIGGVSKVAGKSVQLLSGGVAKWLSEDKSKIIGYINTMSNDISVGFASLGSASENLLNIVTGSMTRMGPQIEDAIANLLSGTSTLLGGLGIIVSGAFAGASEVINQWTVDNQGVIGTFCDNLFIAFDDVCNLIGTVFGDLGDSLTQWWESGGGKELWDSVCQTVMDVGTIILEVINEWIMPIWDALVVAANSLWSDCLKPIFDKLMDTLTALWNDIIYPLWQKLLKPLVDWIIKTLGPVFKSVFGTIGSVCKTVFETIGGVISGFLTALKGVITFISGVFTGDWKKAWQGISDFFSGIWNSIWSVLKGILNLIIDGINLVWSGIYTVAKGIVDSIGGIAGAIGNIFGQDWSFSMPDCPTIPRLAKGGLAKAPTLAMVGDNPNAASDPEVISPLSKLKDMISDTQQQNGVSDIAAVLTMLKKIYDLLNTQETQYTNVVYLDSEEIERKLVKVRKRKSRRYGGATT